MVAGLGIAADVAQDAVLIGGDLAEQVDDHQQVFEIQVPLAHLDQQVVVAVAEEAVAQFLVAAGTVLGLHFAGVQHAAYAVVPAAAVRYDGGQHASHVRIQAMSFGQPEGVLALEGVGQVQALAGLAGIEQHHADVGAALEVGDAQYLAALEDERRVAAAGQRLLVQRASMKRLSVFMMFPWCGCMRRGQGARDDVGGSEATALAPAARSGLSGMS